MVRRVCDRSFNAKLMEEFDELDVIRASELPENENHARRRMLSGGYTRLAQTTTDPSVTVESLESKLDAMQRTLLHIGNQLGIRLIEPETSRHTPPVSHFSDPSVRDDLNRLPLDNRKSLLRKIDMPRFDGTNAYDWLSKVERFFRIGRYSDYDKLDLIALSLEGDVLKWYNWEVIRRDFVSWEEFRRRLLRRFGPAPEKSSEKKPIHQIQVPVSQLEPSLQIPKASPNVCENAQAVVGCEHQRSFQKKIRMDVVNGDVERSQRVMSITKNVSAHQVFDTMCQLNRLKPKNQRKLSLSPKSRMFKFKNKTLLSNWSQMNLHPVIDISNVTNSYSCFSADFGLVRKKRTFQCLRLRTLRLHKQAHMSRFLYPMRRLHDPGGKKDEHSDDNFETAGDVDNVAEVMNVIGDVKGKVAKNPVAFHSNVAAATSISQSMFVCVREFASLLEVICLWDECMMHTTTVISATLYSLFSCEVDTTETISSGLSQIRQVWEPGGILSDHVLVDNVAAGFGSGKPELLATGQQMQRTDLFSELLKDSSNGGAESFPILNVVTEHSFLWLQKTSENYLLVSEFEIQKQMLGYKTRMFKYKRRFQEISLIVTQFLCEKVQRVSCLSLAAQFNSLAIIKAVLEQIIQGETSTKIIDSADYLVDLALDRLGKDMPNWERMSIWHRWRRKDCTRPSSCVLPLLFSFFKLEDKLVFRGGSIDTFHQAYIESRGEDLARGLDDVAEVVTQTGDSD